MQILNIILISYFVSWFHLKDLNSIKREIKSKETKTPFIKKLIFGISYSHRTCYVETGPLIEKMEDYQSLPMFFLHLSTLHFLKGNIHFLDKMFGAGISYSWNRLGDHVGLRIYHWDKDTRDE